MLWNFWPAISLFLNREPEDLQNSLLSNDEKIDIL